MNKSIFAAALVAALIFAPVSVKVLAHAHNHDTHKTDQATHACPMNPRIQGVEGDTCPKCGMDLEPINKADHRHEHLGHEHQGHDHQGHEHQGQAH